MKKLYYFGSLAANGTFFVDGKGKMIGYIHENDGDYRPEYMGFIVEYFGGEIIGIDVDDEEYDEDWEKFTHEDYEDTLERLKPKVLEAIQKANKKTKKSK